MKLQYKEDPKEWRKATLLSLIGPSVLTGVLRWRGTISWTAVAIVFAIVVLVATCAILRSRWFRGYYRFMTWFGFQTVQLFGMMLLTVLYFCFVTPLGWALRLAGRDLLQLKRSDGSQTFWQPARQNGSLDNMF